MKTDRRERRVLHPHRLRHQGGRFATASGWLDADGENAQSALRSAEPIISPAWAPNGNQLAYVSFESRLSSSCTMWPPGKRRLVANFKGLQQCPGLVAGWQDDRRHADAVMAARSRLRWTPQMVSRAVWRSRALSTPNPLSPRRQVDVLRQ